MTVAVPREKYGEGADKLTMTPDTVLTLEAGEDRVDVILVVVVVIMMTSSDESEEVAILLREAIDVCEEQVDVSVFVEVMDTT